MKIYKIAVFSGVYPDTSFLTLLVRRLAEDKCFEVQIFGKKLKTKKIDNNLNFYTYPKNKIFKIFFILKYLILMSIFNFNKTKKFICQLKKDNLLVTRLLIILPILYRKPDVIHIQWIKSYNIFEGFEKIIDSKFIVSIRGHQLSVSSFLCSEVEKNVIDATNHSLKIHSISDDLTDQLLLLNPSVKDKIVKIKPAIDLSLFNHTKDSTKNEVIQIITVCRLSWKKGLHYGLMTIKLLKDCGLPFHYNIIGDGNQKEELQYLINDLGLEENVTLHGSIKQFEVKRLLESSDIFFLPSLQEGFSNAVIEAQAMRLPCIVSDAEGLSENIENGVTGFVFRKRNIHEAAITLQKIMELNKSDFIKMKYNAEQRAIRLYDINNQIKEFKAMYIEVTQS